MLKKSGAVKSETLGRTLLPRSGLSVGVCTEGPSNSADVLDIESLVAMLVSNIVSNPQNMELLSEYFGGQGRVLISKCIQVRNVANCEIIRPRDLPSVTGLSRTQCWRLSRDPASGFPSKIRLSSGAVGYSREHLEVWLKSKEEVKP